MMSNESTCADVNLADLERQIATEHSRVFVECHAAYMGRIHDTPVYDVSRLESTPIKDPDLLSADLHELQRCVRYLDARQMLARPSPAQPSLVSFSEAAAS